MPRRLLGALLIGLMAVGPVLLWIGVPVGWLWVGSQVVYHGGSNMLGIVVAFFGILLSLLVTLALATRLDRFWRLLRRAAGHDQRTGVMVPIFGATAVIALVAFSIWFLLLEGPAPSLAPR